MAPCCSAFRQASGSVAAADCRFWRSATSSLPAWSSAWRWLSGRGPPRAGPVIGAQLSAAIDAVLLALVLWFFFPYRRHDGEVFALLVTLHPISRFFLEMIRRDEPGQFGTSLTISQWL